MTTLEVKGIKKLRRRMRRFPKEVREDMAWRSVGVGAFIIKNEAVRRAPLGPSGNLRSGIRAYRVKTAEGRRAAAWSVLSKAAHHHLVVRGRTKSGPPMRTTDYLGDAKRAAGDRAAEASAKALANMIERAARRPR